MYVTWNWFSQGRIFSFTNKWNNFLTMFHLKGRNRCANTPNLSRYCIFDNYKWKGAHVENSIHKWSALRFYEGWLRTTHVNALKYFLAIARRRSMSKQSFSTITGIGCVDVQLWWWDQDHWHFDIRQFFRYERQPKHRKFISSTLAKSASFFLQFLP